MLRGNLDAPTISNINKAVELIVAAFKGGRKLLIFGNGGSAAQAQHMASELVWRFKKERRALPAIALTSDVAVLTAIANDDEYSNVFRRQIEALGVAGDIVLGITTSGESMNIIRALARSKAMGLHTVVLNNRQHEFFGHFDDIEFDFISTDMAKAQEVHLMIIHKMCEMIEREFD